MRAVLDLVWPSACAACARPGPPACPACRLHLDRPARVAWPTPSPPGMPRPFAVADYADPVRSLLLAYKEEGVVGLRHPLGHALAAAVHAVLSGHAPVQAMLVPVPSSRAARRDRGDDVVATLARTAARVLRARNVPVRVLPALRHRRRVLDSAQLGAAARATNLRGAFELRRGAAALVAGAHVVLVDDLVTTGATLTEAAGVLRAAGADVLGAAAVAATRRRGG